MCRRSSGSVGRGGGPAFPRGPPLFPPEPPVLEEGERELAQQRVVVQPAPGAALELVEPELLFRLPVRPLADPARLDQGRQDLERRIGRLVRQVVLPPARRAALADQPSLAAGQVPGSCHRRAVGHPHAHGREGGPQRPLGAAPPGDQPKWPFQAEPSCWP
jgi:hypothetical protein